MYIYECVCVCVHVCTYMCACVRVDNVIGIIFCYCYMNTNLKLIYRIINFNKHKLFNEYIDFIFYFLKNISNSLIEYKELYKH